MFFHFDLQHLLYTPRFTPVAAPLIATTSAD